MQDKIQDTNGKIIAGIDVGKTDLALSIAAGPVQHYPNTPEGITALTLELARQPAPVALAVYEPTGGYERPLGEALYAARVPACRVHANRVRAYAQARGQLAKTDRLDAQILARYGADIVLPQMADRVDVAADTHAAPACRYAGSAEAPGAAGQAAYPGHEPPGQGCVG